MSPTLYLSIEDMEYEGMTLLWVYVPPTSTVERCANRIYDRNEDGDMDITDSPLQLQNMYNRKSNTYAEHKIFPYVTTDDLRMDLMDEVRNLARSKNPDHLWLKMADEEILKKEAELIYNSRKMLLLQSEGGIHKIKIYRKTEEFCVGSPIMLDAIREN